MGDAVRAAPLANAAAALEEVVGLAVDVLGTGVGFVSCVEGERFDIVATVDRQAMGFTAGLELELEDTMCVRHLDGRAADHTFDAATDPAYGAAPARTRFGITSYVIAPIVLPDGTVWGTLCVLDREQVEVTEDRRRMLRRFASVAAHLVAADAAPTLGAPRDDDTVVLPVVEDTPPTGVPPYEVGDDVLVRADEGREHIAEVWALLRTDSLDPTRRWRLFCRWSDQGTAPIPPLYCGDDGRGARVAPHGSRSRSVEGLAPARS